MKALMMTLSACMLLCAAYAQPKHKPVVLPAPKSAPVVRNRVLTPAQRSVGRAPLPPSPPPPPLAPRN